MSNSNRLMSINEIVGFLFRNGAENAARFITHDAGRQAVPELFQYKDGQMAISGLGLLEQGKTARLKELAVSNSEAVKTLVTFAHYDRGAIYQAAKSQRSAQVMEDTIDLLDLTFYPHTSTVIANGFFKDVKSDLSLEQVGGLKRGLDKLQLSQVEKEGFEDRIQHAAESALKAGFDSGGYGKRAVNPQEKFALLRSVMSEADANSCIRNAIYALRGPSDYSLLETAIKAENSAEAAEEIFAEAKRAGMSQGEIFTALTKGNVMGISLVDKVAMRADAGTLALFVNKVRETGGAEADKFLNEFIGKRRAIFDDKIGYDLQDVYHKLKIGTPEYEKIVAFGPMRSDKAGADFETVQKLVLDIQPIIYDYLDKNPPKDSYAKGKAEKLRKFADECGPVAAGPTIVGYAETASLKFFVDLQKQAAKLDNRQAADWLLGELSEVKDVASGGTCMHEGWAGSTLLGPPGSSKSVRTHLPEFVLELDKIFGTDVAVPLVKKLFALTDANGQRPLDRTLGAGPSDKYAGPYYEAIVEQLSATLKDPAKFTRYMDEAIVPNLPPAFVYGAPKDDPTGKYTGRRRGFDL